MSEEFNAREAKNLLKQYLVPTVLGHGIGAHLLAFRLYWKYGCPSMLCGSRKNLLDLLDPFAGFFRLSMEERLAAEQLAELADGYEDCIFLSVPLSEEGRSFLRREKDLLDCRYILADPKELPHGLPFGRICSPSESLKSGLADMLGGNGL